MRAYSIGAFFEVWVADKKNWLDQAKFLETLEGLEHVEIMLENVDLDDKEIEYLSKLLSPYKKIVHAPFMNLSILSPHKEIVGASLVVYKKAGEIAEQLHADTMTFHLETYPNYYYESEVENITKKVLEKLSQDMNMKIAIENISYGGKTRITYPSSPEQMIRLSQILGKDVGFTIDIGHFISDGFDPIEVIEKLKNKVFDIHLHDATKGKAHLELGKGVLNLAKLINTLDSVQYSGFVSLEVVGRKETQASWKALRRLVEKTSTDERR